MRYHSHEDETMDSTVLVSLLVVGAVAFLLGGLSGGLAVGASLSSEPSPERPRPAAPEESPPYAVGEEFSMLGVTFRVVGLGVFDGIGWRPGLRTYYAGRDGVVGEQFFPPCEWAGLPPRPGA